MATVDGNARRLTRALIHLDHLTDNFRLLQSQAGSAQVWPVLKANGYGHDAVIVAELAAKLGTINYEIVTAIAHRVPRLAVANRTE